jgi:hypothetical protein
MYSIPQKKRAGGQNRMGLQFAAQNIATANNTTMTKLNIFWMSAVMALSDMIMLRQFAGTGTAIVYAVLTGTALFLMVQAAISTVEE